MTDEKLLQRERARKSKVQVCLFNAFVLVTLGWGWQAGVEIAY